MLAMDEGVGVMARGDAKDAPKRADRRLDHDLIVRLGQEGATATEVVRAHIAAGKGPLKASSVYPIWHRYGIKPHAARYKDDIPWVLREEDSQEYIPQMLRAAARRRRGLKNAPDQEQKLDKFLRKLERDGDVVHYDPLDAEARKGFILTQRRPGIDTGLIRSPWYTDRGARIPNPAGLRAGVRPPWETDEPSPVIDLRGGSPAIDLRSRSRSKV